MLDRDEILLEDVRSDDLDALLTASIALHRDERAAAPNPRDLRIDLYRRLSGTRRAVLFRCGDEAIGFALYAPPRKPGGTARIEQFRIEPAVRRHGLGRRCVETVVAERLEGAAHVDVRVLAGNLRALAFWRAVGFEEEARAPRRLEVVTLPDGAAQ